MDQDERIEEKRNVLLSVFNGLSEEKMKVASDLIDQAAFLGVTLEDLADDIRKSGATEVYTNGRNQSGRKVSSSAKLYSSLIAKYTAIVTKLLQIIPDAQKKTCIREIPERAALHNVEYKADDGAANYKKRMKADAAFLDALAAGKVTQDDYKDFVTDEFAAE